MIQHFQKQINQKYVEQRNLKSFQKRERLYENCFEK